MIDQILHTLVAATIAVLLVGALTGCNTTQPDMSRQEAIDIDSLVIAVEKPHEKESPKARTGT